MSLDKEACSFWLAMSRTIATVQAWLDHSLASRSSQWKSLQSPISWQVGFFPQLELEVSVNMRRLNHYKKDNFGPHGEMLSQRPISTLLMPIPCYRHCLK